MPAMRMDASPSPQPGASAMGPSSSPLAHGRPARAPGDADPHADMAGMKPEAMGVAPGDGMAGMSGHGRGALGDYTMTRDAAGTAWQPDSSPMEGVHGQVGGWSTMVHGYAALIYDDQGGPRGDRKTFVESMLMAMAQRPLGGGVLALRGMVSADPLMGASGYPLLFQTGETADGRTQLTDRQHPHDLFMELAGLYSHPISGRLSGFVYFGLPGEPALGPATYMHRFSGMASPEAPISHHWLDSTHITFGVATAGLVYDGFKLEGSRFTGREPDQHRYDIEAPRFDSWSVRASWNPTPDWSLQLSHGELRSPEQLEPNIDQRRTTASVTYNRSLVEGNWQTTLAGGRNEKQPGTSSYAILLDSAVSIGRHTLFGRAERVDKDELFGADPTSPLCGRMFTVAKLSLGYVYTLPIRNHLGLDFGALVSRYALPAALDPVYGSDPTSIMLFTRVKLR